MLALLPLYSLALAEDWPPGATIDPAATADITADGFDALAGLIPALLPESIPVGDIEDSREGWTCFDSYEYSVTNLQVLVEVADAKITPQNGVLDLDITLDVALNSESDPFYLYTYAICIGDTCNGRVDSFPVNIHTTIALEVIDDGSGGKVLDATIGEIVPTYPELGDYIHLDDCAIGTLNDVMDFFGLNLYDLILGLVGDQLTSAIADFGPTIEETIEDAFASASIEQDIEVNGAMLHVQLQPSDVEITPAGARVFMAGAMSGAAADCVAAYDPGGSPKTLSDPPAIGNAPTGIDPDFHIDLSVSDDFANEALYALWRGGLLCYTLDENGPVSLDTSILNSLSEDAFLDVFPEGQPMTIVTRPMSAPVVNYSGSHDLDIDIKKLGVDFYANLDGRDARIVGLDLDAPAGVDLDLDGTTGELGIIVDIDASKVTPTVSYNEIAAAANATIEEKFSGLFQTILDTLVGSLLDSLAFALPSFNGIGLERLEVSAAGSQGDWLGLFAWVGNVTYGADGGCGGCGGDSSSCSGGGCSTSPAAPFGLATLLAFVLSRRRK